MSETRPQSPTESQQLLRFTARDPNLYGGLREFETRPPDSDATFEKDLFLFAMKGISYNKADPHSESLFGQFRQDIGQMTNHGLRKFFLQKDFVKELHSGGLNGELVGVQFRLVLDQMAQRAILGPLYGNHDLDDPTDEEPELSGTEELAYSLGLPISYRFRNRVRDPESALMQLYSIVSAGAWVSQIAVVPRGPLIARERDIFMQPRLQVSQKDFRRYVAGLSKSDNVAVLSTAEAEKRDTIRRKVS